MQNLTENQDIVYEVKNGRKFAKENQFDPSLLSLLANKKTTKVKGFVLKEIVYN